MMSDCTIFFWKFLEGNKAYWLSFNVQINDPFGSKEKCLCPLEYRINASVQAKVQKIEGKF